MRWTDRVINEELRRVKEKKNIVNIIKRRKAKLIVHILRMNRLLRYVIEGKIKGVTEVTGRRRKRRK
jgi:hypothetical protein